VSKQDRWPEYIRTVVDVAVPGLAPVRIRPAPPGTVGVWPSAFEPPVYFLTAWDPGGQRPGDAENRRRHDALIGELHGLGLATWSTVGHDPRTDHREVGVAVAGLSEDEALDLGRRYGQDAIFGWTPGAWSVVSCFDGDRHVGGWRLQAPSP
jgi:hypothetical protein